MAVDATAVDSLIATVVAGALAPWVVPVVVAAALGTAAVHTTEEMASLASTGMPRGEGAPMAVAIAVAAPNMRRARQAARAKNNGAPTPLYAGMK